MKKRTRKPIKVSEKLSEKNIRAEWSVMNQAWFIMFGSDQILKILNNKKEAIEYLNWLENEDH